MKFYAKHTELTSNNNNNNNNSNKNLTWESPCQVHKVQQQQQLSKEQELQSKGQELTLSSMLHFYRQHLFSRKRIPFRKKQNNNNDR